MSTAGRPVVLDDRLLIEELLLGIPAGPGLGYYTTPIWYYRACRAAVAGAGGQLSGPFEHVDAEQQERAILSLLQLREDILLPDPRMTVPAMAELALRHPRLNLLHLEATASAQLLDATVWLSSRAALGVLPTTLDAEGVGLEGGGRVVTPGRFSAL